MTTGKKLIVGTRGSRLAHRQTEGVVAALQERCPDCRFELHVIRTTGDRRRDDPLAAIGGEGVFTKELESALLARRIDIAVHSLKDLPTTVSEGLAIAAVTRRDDSRDALVTRGKMRLAELPPGARVGTGSPRRSVQLRLLRPDLEVVAIRGNVDTRLAKVEAGEAEAVVVAAAALARLGWLERATEILPTDVMLPAPGQGALAVEMRSDDAGAREVALSIDDRDSRLATAAERAFLRGLGGGCRVPIAALAVVEGDELRLRGLVADAEGRRVLRAELTGSASDAEAMGIRLAEELLSQGAAALLKETL